jgi:N-acetylglucosamine-6-phosphate deacetylase
MRHAGMPLPRLSYLFAFKGRRSMRFTLRGARLVDATTDLTVGNITIDNAQIQAIGAELDKAEEPGQVIDATNTVVMPGFIDVHTHGGGGFNLHTTNVEEIHSYLRWVNGTGVTSCLIAVVGIPDAVPLPQLQTAAQAIEQTKQYEQATGAEPLGIHMEGPYFSVVRRGAHPPSWLRMPDESETEHVLEAACGHLRLITLAPELPGAHAMIHRLVEAGVTVSMGHTDADYEQAQEAIRLGATHATHCFNAMRPLHHRHPGPLAAVSEASQVRGELIGDGIHVHPALMHILVKMLGPERVVVITDAQACAGVPNGVFEFAGQHIHLADGAAMLDDGTLAGSVLTMDLALRNMLQFTGVSLSDAVRMQTLNPATAIGVANRKGRLLVGYDADLVIMDGNLNLQATICRGRVTFATEQWREHVAALLAR